MTTENTEGLAAPAVTQPASEPIKMVPQHEVNALMAGVKQRAYEKGRQDRDAEMQSRAQSIGGAPTASQGDSSISEDKLRQIASEEVQKQQAALQQELEKQRQHAAGMQILNDLNTKMSPAQSKFEDFKDVVKPDLSNFQQTPEVLFYANQFDNPGEILYDLAKNPSKMANIALMHRMGMGAQAFSDMKKLSDSIKTNEMSANQPKPKAPLTQVTPSTVGVGNVDEDSYVSRFKGKY